MITYFAVVTTYNLAHKKFRKFCVGCLYKRLREKQVPFDIFALCMIYCFTPEKINGFCDVEYSML